MNLSGAEPDVKDPDLTNRIAEWTRSMDNRLTTILSYFRTPWGVQSAYGSNRNEALVETA